MGCVTLLGMAGQTLDLRFRALNQATMLHSRTIRMIPGKRKVEIDREACASLRPATQYYFPVSLNCESPGLALRKTIRDSNALVAEPEVEVPIRLVARQSETNAEVDAADAPDDYLVVLLDLYRSSILAKQDCPP